MDVIFLGCCDHFLVYFVFMYSLLVVDVVCQSCGRSLPVGRSASNEQVRIHDRISRVRWAGALMEVFGLKSAVKKRETNRPLYRVTCTRLKRGYEAKITNHLRKGKSVLWANENCNKASEAKFTNHLVNNQELLVLELSEGWVKSLKLKL